ncbi:low-density lipoprotein receptor class A domain-containing protein 3-like [Acanthaster planci]|uniref:Low-density lipoprotein receptor class A domain-containing protein 3-like n=1 Tax=Acanthaster planci TaxID=133434 RepID=A0A8B7XPJ9_ACAPL|nr:low-density lipoprotein receptor class A domain-containing protein 3-like [Acanthaster planci]
MASFGREWILRAAYCLPFFVLFLPNRAASINVANCSLSGCENGGTCMQMPNSDIFSCLCLPEWTGDLCIVKVQVTDGPGCSSSPCLNGGTCQNFMDHYLCLCDFFWKGKHCETFDFQGFEASPPIKTPCSLQEYRCDDGHCVIQKYICDGTGDCPDGSDEKYCSSSMPSTVCQEGQFPCIDGICIPKDWRCNQVEDCRRGEDEHSCGSAVTARSPAEDRLPGTPVQPVESSLSLIDILIVSCAMLMTFMAVTIFVYVRRVRRMQQRYFAAVGHPHHLYHHHHHHHGRRHRRSRTRRAGRGLDGGSSSVDAVTTPYRLSQHSNFCHHLPPHRCPARTNLLVSYNLASGVHIPNPASASDKEEEIEDEVPPTYMEVVGAGMTAAGVVTTQGDETPPPAYEDLNVGEVL